MAKNCKNIPCGCGDQSLNTPPPCNVGEPCLGETCSELFCDECILYCGDDISIEDKDNNTFTITQGMRLSTVLQKLMIRIMDPTCVDSAALDLRSLSKTSDSITINWIGDLSANYKIFWDDGVNQNFQTVTGITHYTIINLTPDTEYSIKLFNEETSCESVIIKIKTNSI